jgi:hypothetical protein
MVWHGFPNKAVENCLPVPKETLRCCSFSKHSNGRHFQASPLLASKERKRIKNYNASQSVSNFNFTTVKNSPQKGCAKTSAPLTRAG